ncbi:MAG: dihydroorotate dehydrogenase [Firmicutes bacterium]|nr:dihydroorotate dehydrogenase [Bacillota bacterium]
MADLKIKIARVEFKNPIIMASGTFGFGAEYGRFYDLNILGGFCTKGMTINPKDGNASPRVAETPSGMLNSVGLQNPGVDEFIKYGNQNLKNCGTRVIANVAGASLEDYMAALTKIDKSDFVDMIELNISCPNVKQGGIAFGVDPKSTFEIVSKAKKATKKPLMVKLTPNVSDIRVSAKAAEDAGADALSLINTVGGMAIDYKTKRPVLKTIYGGLSGPAVKPIALKMVNQVYNTVKIPIVGMGGIETAEDILEFFIAGSAAVQIGTANFYDPNIGKRLVNDLTNMLKKCNIDRISDLTGSLIVD